MRRLFTCLVAILFTVGCATGKADREYSSAVERAYHKAEESMDRGDYTDATTRFNAVRSQFPYSRFATLAELRLGDAYFEQEQYTTAVAQYRSFLKLYPNHPEVPYASYRIARAFVEEMPGDFVLLPPSYERELRSTRDAERELKYFLERYADSEYAPDARRDLALVRRRLADYELYVAKFYLKKKNYRACAMRAKYLLENYSGVGLDSRALFLIARSYLELGDVDRAKTALDDLITNFPDDRLARQAQSYLERHSL